MIKDKYIKNLIKAILVIAFYLITYLNQVEIITFLFRNFISLSYVLKTTILTLYETLILMVVICAYKKEIIQSYNNFKGKGYVSKYIKYWFLILILMMISNNIVVNFTANEVATNQEIIIDSFKSAPIYILITTVLIAPILEELIFRFCIKKIIPKPSIIYILLSGIIFGSMHVILTLEHASDLLFIIPYSIPGIIFAYIYDKTDNIFIPASLHLIHNGTLMFLQIILALV